MTVRTALPVVWRKRLPYMCLFMSKIWVPQKMYCGQLFENTGGSQTESDSKVKGRAGTVEHFGLGTGRLNGSILAGWLILNGIIYKYDSGPLIGACIANYNLN